MPVAVGRPDADEGHPRREGLVERGALIARAVVRDLDHVGPRNRAVRHQPLLLPLAEVAE
ncbi:hypothetical protein [Frondihabitans cladoniiphilus]|uniref:hypothetical protein n=1 Tax=Frondihabitans cladoniiphilus TaxID=715785 RepID=UPI0031E7CCA2